MLFQDAQRGNAAVHAQCGDLLAQPDRAAVASAGGLPLQAAGCAPGVEVVIVVEVAADIGLRDQHHAVGAHVDIRAGIQLGELAHLALRVDMYQRGLQPAVVHHGQHAVGRGRQRVDLEVRRQDDIAVGARRRLERRFAPRHLFRQVGDEFVP